MQYTQRFVYRFRNTNSASVFFSHSASVQGIEVFRFRSFASAVYLVVDNFCAGIDRSYLECQHKRTNSAGTHFGPIKLDLA